MKILFSFFAKANFEKKKNFALKQFGETLENFIMAC